MKNKFAFTLAEVLITLVIIGVVAALTIPTAIAKYQKQETVNRLKHVFSQFSQAVNLSIPKYGDTSTWDYSLTSLDFFNQYLKNNLVIVKKMSLDTSEVRYQTSSGGYEGESGLAIVRNGANVYILNSGIAVFISNLENDHNFVLHKKKCFGFDINGFKGPNKFGRDMFYLCLDGNRGRVVPSMVNDSEPLDITRTREQLKNGSFQSYHCNKTNGRGMWCAALIVNDGWQIKDDYPW